jgi:hypothetical protein
MKTFVVAALLALTAASGIVAASQPAAAGVGCSNPDAFASGRIVVINCKRL